MNYQSISDQLKTIKQQHSYRQRKILDSAQGVEVIIDRKSYLSFCSNDYLGLANHPAVRTATCKTINEFGVGSGASQLISGYSSTHERLEEALAEFLNFERVLLFSSGYLANLGVIDALASRNSFLIEDRLNHASLIDAARYAGTRLQRYRHLDDKHAAELLRQANCSQILLATDGVFSMEGTMAPLEELCALKQKYDALLIVDDAHGIGTLGTHGRGSLEHQKISSSNIDVLVGTFGKAFGSAGAFIATNNYIAEYLLQKSRTLIYTTALPPAFAAAAHASLNIIIQEPERRERLNNNVQYFRECLTNSSLNLQNSFTPIQTIVIGDNEKALNMSEQLLQQGILVVAIRPPTVPAGTARLRITICSEHTFSQIDKLVSTLLDLDK